MLLPAAPEARAMHGLRRSPTFMHRACQAAALTLLLLAAPLVRSAVFGDIRTHSWLGGQLKASIPLSAEAAGGSEVRCYRATLEVAGNSPQDLKLALQRTAKGSILLLSGGSPAVEPAATVRMEDMCAGTRRQYAVLLDPAPADTVWPASGMLKLARILAPRADPSAARPPSPLASGHPGHRLRLEQSLSVASHAALRADDRKAAIPLVLSLAAALAAAAWIGMRVRAMRTRPWMSDVGAPDARG